MNDNTVGPKGAKSLAQALPNFVQLELLNLGDCLLKKNGAIEILGALSEEGHFPQLTELNLGFNELRQNVIGLIIDALRDKTRLSSLEIDGNFFGRSGCEELRSKLTLSRQINALGSLEEDASDDDESSEESDVWLDKFLMFEQI